MSDDWAKRAVEVLTFGLKLKSRMIELNKTRVRVKCPNPAHARTKYMVWATCNLKGNNHIHLACEDPDCYYKMME